MGNMKDNNRQIEVFDEDTDEIDLLEIFHLLKGNLVKIGSSNIEMGKKWYENIIFSFIYAIISMKVIY